VHLAGQNLKLEIVFKSAKEKQHKKKVGKWMSLCCTIGYKWVTVIEGVKFEFNDIISLYKKNDSERKRSVSL